MTDDFAQVDLRLFGQTELDRSGNHRISGLTIPGFIASLQHPITKTVPGLGFFAHSNLWVYQDGHFEIEVWLSIFGLRGRTSEELYEKVSTRLMAAFPAIERITSVPEEESLERMANLPGFRLENGVPVRTEETFEEIQKNHPEWQEG